MHLKNMVAKFKAVDLVVILSFVFFASLYQINRMAGNSFSLFYASDTASLAGFAAAGEHPELFAGDELLADRDNFSFYSTIHLPLAKMIARFTGDYASAFTLLLWLHNILLPLGFYILGRIFFQSRYWGALLGILNLMPVPLAVTEFWGIYSDFLPRISFHVLLPFMLAVVFYRRFKAGSWPVILSFIGLSMFIYPASVPSWGFAIWLGLWLFLPSSWNIFKRAGFMFMSGICFFLGALPFSINYLSHHAHGNTGDYNLIYEIMNYRYPDELFNALYAFKSFISNLTFLRVSLFGLIGIIYVWFRYRLERKSIVLVFMWILGILITSVAIPFAEQVISHKYKVFSLEIELVRNTKYLFPLMLLFCLWPFAAITKYSTDIKKRKAVFVIGFILVFGWGLRQMYKHVRFLDENGYFLFNPDKSKSADIMDTLGAIKRLTPEKSRFLVLASFPELAIRYYAFRPLVYTYKDGASFIYTDHAKLIKWYEKAKDMDETTLALKQVGNGSAKTKIMADFSRRFNAEYLVVDRIDLSDSFVVSDSSVVYSNSRYVIMEMIKA